jgi:DNA repair photolyase
MGLISLFDPWRSKFCTCSKKYSLSPYTGCGHGCLYCYASSYIRNFYLPRPKKDFLKRLQREVKKLPKNSYLTMANSSDPYLPQEKELKLTSTTLRLLKDYNLKLMLVTKSSLILRDINILTEFRRILVGVSLTTLKEKLSKRLEPYASGPLERLRTIEKLAKYLNVVCRVDPLIYPLNTKEIKTIIKEVKNAGAKQIITSTYKAKPDNLKRMMGSFPEYKDIWHKLYILMGEKVGRYMYLPSTLRERLINEVKNLTLEEGLDFSSCREGLNYLNTKLCDGSSFF